MKPAEIKRRFDEIADFAELGDFLDMPVRNYSSGMSVRLGFAIAMIGTPEILLVDEVLAVGDLAFQKKCYERIAKLKEEGTTIMLVSHSPGAIWAVCNKGMLIHKGRSAGVAPVEEVCKAYDHANMVVRLGGFPKESANNFLRKDYGGLSGGTGDVIVNSVELLNERGMVSSEIDYGASFLLRQHIEVRQPLQDLIFRVQVDSEVQKAVVILDSYEAHAQLYSLAQGTHVVDIEVTCPNLRPGLYKFCPSVVKKNIGVHLFFKYNMASLIIKQPVDSFFYADFRASTHLRSQFAVF